MAGLIGRPFFCQTMIEPQRVSGCGSRFIPLFAVLVLLTGCRSGSSQKALQRCQFTHPAMGTLITITLFAPDPVAGKAAAAAAFQRIDALEDIMSDYQADSEVMRLCDQPFGTPVPVSMELFDVLQRAQKVSRLSDGAFDVTVGPYIRLWRFARKRKVLPTPAEIAAAGAAVGWQKLRLDARKRTGALYGASLSGEKPRQIMEAASNVQYSEGYLLYLRETVLVAQRFDPKSLKFTGDPTPVAEKLDYWNA